MRGPLVPSAEMKTKCSPAGMKAKYPCAARVPSLRGIVVVKSTQAQVKPTNPIRFGDLNERSSGAGDRQRRRGTLVPAIGSEGEVLWCRRSAAVAKTKRPRAAWVPLLQTQFDPNCLNSRGVAVLVFSLITLSQGLAGPVLGACLCSTVKS